MFQCTCGNKYKDLKQFISHTWLCESNTVYRCECGREFQTKASLISHGRFCPQYKKKDKTSKYKISDTCYRCECGKEFTKSQSLNAHFRHCDIHCDAIGKERVLTKSELTHSMNWDNKTQDELNDIRDKAAITWKQRYNDGEIIPSFKDKHHAEESRDKIRVAKSILHGYIDSGPLYNRKSIKYIDELNDKMGWNLQHAENGGEKTCAGYYIDAYDKDLNIAFEYDEPKHYTDWRTNILRDYDIHRMKRIKELLGCTFYRYNEKLDYFYKVEDNLIQ